MVGESTEWLTVAQVAQRLQLNDETVRRWIRAGELPALDLGKKAGYRVRPEDLAAFLEARYGLAAKSAA